MFSIHIIHKRNPEFITVCRHLKYQSGDTTSGTLSPVCTGETWRLIRWQ